ncbi:MAG: hypothetical protein ABI183_14160 [Polyangiaceae bacterium]
MRDGSVEEEETTAPEKGGGAKVIDLAELLAKSLAKKNAAAKSDESRAKTADFEDPPHKAGPQKSRGSEAPPAQVAKSKSKKRAS